jgi:hypothetical protein
MTLELYRPSAILAGRIVKAGRAVATSVLSLIVAFACLPSGYLLAQVAESLAVPSPTTTEIVAKLVAMNKKRAEALQSFTSQRVYELDYTGFPSHKHARMIVDARFDAPQNKELAIVSEEGSGLLRNRVLHQLVSSELEANNGDNRSNTALTDANYNFSLIGREQMDGHDCFVLDVKAKTKSKFLYNGKIWVDSKDFAVVHIRAQPAKNPSFWIKRVDIEHQYEKVGAFWLPKINQSTSSIRLGGRAALRIDYGSYDVRPKEEGSPNDNPIPGTTQ